MSKALWFSIAILLCAALEAEALNCKRHKKIKIGSSFNNNKTSKTCIAKPGQKCKITRYRGNSSELIAQACTKSTDECHLTLGQAKLDVLDIKCCDNSDFCNIP